MLMSWIFLAMGVLSVFFSLISGRGPQLSGAVATGAQAGITLQSMEIVTVNFLGEEHYAMYTVAETQDVPYYMVQLLNYDIGAYGVTLTISSFIEDKTGEVLDLFYKVG